MSQLPSAQRSPYQRLPFFYPEELNQFKRQQGNLSTHNKASKELRDQRTNNGCEPLLFVHHSSKALHYRLSRSSPRGVDLHYISTPFSLTGKTRRVVNHSVQWMLIDQSKLGNTLACDRLGAMPLSLSLWSHQTRSSPGVPQRLACGDHG